MSQAYAVTNEFIAEIAIAAGFTAGQVNVSTLPRFSKMAGSQVNAATVKPTKFTKIQLVGTTPATAVVGVVSAKSNADGTPIIMPVTLHLGVVREIEGVAIAAVIPTSTGGTLPTGVTDTNTAATTTGITLQLSCA